MSTRYTVSIDADVRAVLEGSAITATALTLPPGQLERGLYERVNKVLVAAGGTWNRKAGAHLFDRDPREALGLALESGAIQDERKARQQFFTPPGLAQEMCRRAAVGPGMTVLEPSAGSGVLATQAWLLGATVTCVELDRTLYEGLELAGFLCHWGNFLGQHPSPHYDAVVMNPPFTGGQDVDHVLHALGFVRPGGRLVAIVSNGAMTNQARAAQAFRVVVEDLAAEVVTLPETTFRDAGTSVRTTLVELHVPR